MQNVTKAGPQRATCPIEDCDRPPHNGVVGEYCKGHKARFDRQNGTAAGPPIIELDDPDLLEREARKAAAQETEEYAERRRVKTWKTLENGSRVPEEFWTDEELAAIEDAVGAHVTELSRNVNERTDNLAMPADPVKDATRIFKRALRGKLGELAKEHAWSTVGILDDMQ